jgi:hypothetical protein
MCNSYDKKVRVGVIGFDAVLEQGWQKKGYLVGTANVHVAQFQDGILSREDAGEPFTPSDIEEMDLLVEKYGPYELVDIPDNPVIVLDDGDVFYGCQVYWGEIEEEGENA